MRTFADFLALHFEGKMQKLTVDAGFTCPNRDGTLGRGGCTYCNNHSFSPDQGGPSTSVTQQLANARAFFSRKYPQMRYLAYFQSYTNTYGEIGRVAALYEEALACDGIAGLVIGTRPDCVPPELLEMLAGLHRRSWVMIEYGAESSHDATLRAVNRCHTWADTADAVRRTHAAGMPVGLHLIMGLPGETPEMMLQTVDRVNELPVDVVKTHQLQLIKGTRMAADVARGIYEIPRFTVDEYIDLCCQIAARLRPDIAVERFVSQSPPELLIYPRWNLKNHEFMSRLHRKLQAKQSGA